MSEGNNFVRGLCIGALIAIPLWGALWFGAVYAVGIFLGEGG